MKKIFSKKLWTVLSVATATLLSVMTAGACLATEYAPVINQTLGLETYKTVDNGGEKIQTNPAKYTTGEQINAYGDEVCREIEGEGLVLLKNDDALPMAKNTSISLFGTGSVNINCSSQGMRGNTDKDDFPTLKDAFEAVDVNVNETLWNFYLTGDGKSYGGSKTMVNNIQTYTINEVPWNKYNASITGTFKDYGDAAVVVFTRDSTEGTDVNAEGSDGANGNYLALSPEELTLLKELTVLRDQGTFKRIIVLLNGSQPLQLDFMYDKDVTVDALMWIGNTGMSGVYSVAEAIVGDINPSGKLTDTYVRDNFSSPAMASWILNPNKLFARKWDDSRLNDTQKYYGVYVEGIYVGYRYYETRYADVVEGRPDVGEFDYENEVYATFGEGLSYTTFSLDNYVVEEEQETYEISVDVTNTGDVAGKETVQIYLQKPYTDYAIEHGIEVAAAELVGFAKTPEIEAGGTATVNISVEKEELASYDVYGAGTYIVDAGTYYLAAGNSSHAALNNILAKKGYTVEDGMTEDGNAELVDQTEVDEIDAETYSVSGETGNPITNQLAAADPNRYINGGSNYITYVSRNNWTETWPTEPAVLKLTEGMYEDLQCDIVPEDVDAMPTLSQSNGLTLSMLRGKEFEDDDWEFLLNQMSFEDMNELLTKGYCITSAVTSVVKPQTNGMDGPTYCKESDNGVRMPCEGIWAASFNMELVAKVGDVLANDCLETGYHEMWIPGINIHRTPYCGRYHEYFSEDPFLTGVAAQSEIEAVQYYSVIAYPKHYAFNESECNRNGVNTWFNEQAGREIYLEPWKYSNGVTRGNAHGVMSSFNRVGCSWSSADYGLITGILRNEFGFNGIILTDMADSNGADYMSCVDGIMAGTDIWFSSGVSHSFTAYKNNATVVNAMREACHRVLYTVGNYSAAMNGFSENTQLIRIYVWWEILVTTVLVVLSVLTAGAVVMLCISCKDDIKKFFLRFSRKA